MAAHLCAAPALRLAPSSRFGGNNSNLRPSNLSYGSIRQSSPPSDCKRLSVTCKVTTRPRTRTGEVELDVLPVSKYNDVAKFMVENYYLDGNAGLPGTARRRLEGDQLYDLRQRYMSKGNRDAAVLVAESDGEIGGCAAIVVTPFESNGRPDMDLGSIPEEGQRAAPVLGNLAVASDMRRKGIGRKIMSEAEDICRDWGYDEIWLGVESSNGRARSLYNKLGYKAQFTLTEPSVKVIDGVVEETVSTNVYMRKSLKDGIAGAVENAPASQVVAVILAAAVAVAAKQQPEALLQILDTAASL